MTSMTEHEPLPLDRREVRYRPRRIGHVNLYVSDLRASCDFYQRVCGLELVYDEKELGARFLSNGNSHHDLALMQASTRTITGRDGRVQKTATRGTRAGLNHIAFEMDTESNLVSGIGRSQAAGISPDTLFDHQVARSAYLAGPDAVRIELYADSTSDWQGVYADLDGGLMTTRWEPDAERASRIPHHAVEIDHQPYAAGLARPVRTARAAVVAEDLPAAVGFYRDVIGLDLLAGDDQHHRWVVLCGTLGRPDLLVLERRQGTAAGFHHFSLELEDLDELDTTRAALRSAGVSLEREVTHPWKRGLVLRDPDGFAVELFAEVEPQDELRFHGQIADADFLA